MSGAKCATAIIPGARDLMNDFLADRARISPDHPALLYESQGWTYSELNHWVSGVCARLDRRGVRAGDRVAVLLPNRPEYVVIVHSLVRLDAVLVPLNVRLTQAELAELLPRAQVDWLVTDRPGEADGLLPENRRLSSADLVLPADEEAPEWYSREITLDREWGILFTSGTSGQVKGAVLTLGNVYFSAMSSASRLGSFPDDRWMLGMPLYHIGGLSIVFRCTMYGTTVVLLDGFEPDEITDVLLRQRVTMLSLVPTMLRKIMDLPGFDGLPGYVRLVLLGGAAARDDLVAQALAYGLPIALTYGLTEAASQVATALPAAVREKPGSVGRPLYQTDLRIVNELGELLSVGEYGEIQVKGPTVMKGYLGTPPQTGWLHTGDIGCLDEDGDLYVVQRRSDLIVSGGENVYPAEVERILRKHPMIADVCVVGLPDEIWGQRVAALVVPSDAALTVAELERFMKTRLAGHKRPRTIDFVSELPCTASGKISRPGVVQLLDVRKTV